MADMRDKRVLSTGVVLLTLLADVIGVAIGGPQLVAQIAKRGPEWMASPNLWWIATSLLIAGIALWWIWRRPDESSIYEQLIAEVGETTRHRRMLKLMSQSRSFHRNVRWSGPDLDRERVFRTLEAEYPPLIEIALGEADRDRFVEVVAATRNLSGGDAKVVCNAAIPFLQDRLTIAWEDELNRIRATNAANAAT